MFLMPRLVLSSVLVIFFLLNSAPSRAGGALYVSTTGNASAWDNSTAVAFHPESGTCAGFSNSAMLDIIADDLTVWSGLNEVNLSLEQVTGSIGQVGIDNYESYLFLSQNADISLVSDGLSPVVFDDDAAIIAEVTGEENKYLVLGLAGAVGFNSDYSTIQEGQALFNCRCLTNHPAGPCYTSDNQSVVEVTEEELDFIIVHEMGHFLNLDHSQVNLTQFENGNDSDDKDIPIMFPFVFDPGETITARRDDIQALAGIYPAADFTDEWCLISGNLKDKNGNDLRCADMWAEDGDPGHTVAGVSGALAAAEDTNSDGDTTDSGECSTNCGYFAMYQKAGVEYAVTVKPIETTFVGGSSVGPCVDSQLTTIEEEQVATVTSSQCSAGSTIALGDITTTSSGGVSSGSSGGGTGGGAEGSDSDLNPVGYTCALSPHVAVSSSGYLLLCFVWFCLMALRFNIQNPRFKILKSENFEY